GSNIFNILGIIGVAATLKPLDSTDLSKVDLGMMLALAIALLPAAKSGGRISRGEGLVFLAIFSGYTWWLISNQLT
ncbi:MAG: sodium:calcium antiporter, partial [Rhodobacterales bacterium]